MGVKELVVKLTDHQEEVSAAARREQWVQAVVALFDEVEEWLHEILGDELGRVKIIRDKVEIYEESLGSYEIDVMTIEIGDVFLVLNPVGAVIMGASGRVDFYRGGYLFQGFMLLLRLDDEDGPRWEAVRNTDKRDRSVLDVGSFERMLEEMLSY